MCFGIEEKGDGLEIEPVLQVLLRDHYCQSIISVALWVFLVVFMWLGNG